MFINLHVHTNYSHDCITKIPELVKFVKEDGGSALAITDHGNMSGVVEFYKECKKHNIKPIIGMEMYIVANQGKMDIMTNENKQLNHLVVLAKNKTGYQNLLALHKIANQNYYYKPRIDEETLFAHSEGLIVINGHIQTSIFDTLFFNFSGIKTCETIDCCRAYLWPDYEQRFLAVANRYKQAFGDNFYIECQLFDKEELWQQAASYFLQELAEKHNFKCVGTGDAHYITAKDAEYHRAFCAIKTNTKMSEMADIRYFTSGKYCVVTQQLAKECYPEKLIKETENIANSVKEYNILLPTEIPKFDIKNPRKYIYQKCVKQLEVLNKHNKKYLDQLDEELRILELGNLYDYFLIVADYMNWAKKNNILCGPGRGSAGGCLISYLLGIITIDPLEYGLLFSRFYSEDRAAASILPDIDSDFPASRREDVISYIRNKYGHDRVAGVVTFSTLQGKNALKDVLRIYDACDFSSMNKITELIPARDKISDKLAIFKKETGSDSILFYLLKEEPDLMKNYCYLDDNNNLCGEYAKYFEIAIGLEGAIKAESKHASALIIAGRSIDKVAPLIKDKSSDDLLVGLDMDSFGDTSLVKFDILGVKTFDCLMTVNDLIKEIGIEL